MIKKNRKVVSANCPHSEASQSDGLALIVLQDSRVTSGGNVLCKVLGDVYLSNSTLENVCLFYLSPIDDILATCLSNHKTAIIVDSVANDSQSGTISIMDLAAMLEKATPLKIDSNHGFYLARQLRLLKKSARVPKRIIFLGVGNGTLNATQKEDLGNSARSPQSAKTLSLLVGKVAETLKRNA
jgi:hypothetical protein